jgi:site-specific recombinase XerD
MNNQAEESTKQSTQIVTIQRFMPIVDMVLNTVNGSSKKDYGRALRTFFTWYQDTGQTKLNRATVYAHIAKLKADGVPTSSINQRMAAIRKLIKEAAENDLIDDSLAQGIIGIKNIKTSGRKLGNWLDNKQASDMLLLTDFSLKGVRDRAILALMIGCGLRRSEVVRLTVEHLQQREGRWVILDLVGKHNRTRTVPMAAWIKALIDTWLLNSQVASGVIFRPVNKDGRMKNTPLSTQAIWYIVQEHAPIDGLAPHDLRRTFAKLASKGGSPIAQIQKSLGHESIETTERYIGEDLDLANAPSDCIRLNIK